MRRRPQVGALRDLSTITFRIADNWRVHDHRSDFDIVSPTGDGLATVVQYVERQPSAELRPLYSPANTSYQNFNWSLSVPSESRPGEISGTHILRLAKPADSFFLRRALLSDGRMSYVEHPAIQYPMIDPRPSLLDALEGAEYWLNVCGFRSVWDPYDHPDASDIISLVDCGEDGLLNPDVRDRVHIVHPRNDSGSRATHAGEIAGVISASRDQKGMDGCCSAELRVFDCWTSKGDYDSGSYYDALTAIAGLPPHIVNMSLGTTEHDSAAEEGVRQCLAAGHWVVAAMGDSNTDIKAVYYPAAMKCVIAVGACDQWGSKTATSTEGSHIHLVAPGDRVWTVFGDGDGSFHEMLGGTSFSVAMVSAALWLLRRKNPTLTRKQAVSLLASSANKKLLKGQSRTDALGYGMLDVAELLRQCPPK